MKKKKTRKKARKVVYLKNRFNVQSNETSCGRVVCPGFCACASKSK